MKWKPKNVTKSHCNHLFNSVLRTGQEFPSFFQLLDYEEGIWALCPHAPSVSDKPLLVALSTPTGSYQGSRQGSQGLPISWKWLLPVIMQL